MGLLLWPYFYQISTKSGISGTAKLHPDSDINLVWRFLRISLCSLFPVGNVTKIFLISQILRDGELQGRRDRRLEAEGGHADGGWRDLEVQEGQPDDVRVGDPRPAAVGGRLQPGERTQCQLD